MASAEGPPSVAAPFDVDDPATCAPCHAAVVEEWGRSQHAYAHATRDPLYAGMLALRSERAGRDLEPACASCHHPRAVDDTDGVVAQHGVSCASCHNVAAVGDGRGHAALRFDADGRLFGPHAVDGSRAPHATGAPPSHMTDGQTLCLACHGEVQNPNGVSTCNTGPEFAAHAGDETCVGCHMPEVDAPAGAVSSRSTHRSHAFIAAHGARRSGDDAVMRATAQLTGMFDDGGVVLTLVNTAGHAAPTGFPGRRLQLVLTGADASGAVVWRSAEAASEVQAELAFARYYADDSGNPTMPPFATQLVRDTRLMPAETRSVQVPVPEVVVTVDAELWFHFAAPPALANMGLDDDPHFAPMVIARTQVARMR